MCIGYVTPLTCMLHCLFWNIKREETDVYCYFTPLSLNCMLHCLFWNREREETDVYWLFYSYKLYASLSLLKQEEGRDRCVLVSLLL